jgi:hypothetical protein
MKTTPLVTHILHVSDFYPHEGNWLPRKVEVQATADATHYTLGKMLPAGSILTSSKIKTSHA